MSHNGHLQDLAAEWIKRASFQRMHLCVRGTKNLFYGVHASCIDEYFYLFKLEISAG